MSPGGPLSDDSLLRRLEEALDFKGETRWSLTVGGEPPWSQLSELITGLQGDVGTGENKKVESKYSYIGIGPTIHWLDACKDLFYPVMRDGIESFPRHWRPIEAAIEGPDLHFVSLGVGNGQKDRVILRDL